MVKRFAGWPLRHDVRPALLSRIPGVVVLGGLGIFCAFSAAAAGSDEELRAPAAEILKELKERAHTLVVEIDLSPEDKDAAFIKLRSVALWLAERLRGVLLTQTQAVLPDGTPASAVAGVSRDQTGKIVDALAKTSFLRMAERYHYRHGPDKVVPPPVGSKPYGPLLPDAPHWRISLRVTDSQWAHYLIAASDWKIDIAPFLRAIRAPLDGDAAKAMDALLAPFEGQRKEAGPAALAPRAAEPDWSEAVEGVRLRLQAKETRWKLGDTPKFEVDIWNQGRRKVQFPLEAGSCRIELDGVWYHSTVMYSGEPRKFLLPPGAVQRGIPLPLHEGFRWRREQGNEHLRWKPGKRRVRVALSIEGMTPAELNRIRAVSNPVEIECVEGTDF